MRTRLLHASLWLAGMVASAACAATDTTNLVGTAPLTLQGDLSAQMVAGIDRFLMRATEGSLRERARFWQRDFTSPDAYEKSVKANRDNLARQIGVADERLRGTRAVSFVGSPWWSLNAKLAEREGYEIWEVTWPVLEGVHGSGLLLLHPPKGGGVSTVVEPIVVPPCVIAIPDADQTPRMLAGVEEGVPPENQFARQLAENGLDVLVVALVNRDDTHSGNRKLNRFTNQPHREWIYRQAFQMGRHIIGYEVQKVLAAVELLSATRTNLTVAGYGEGGLVAFYSAALDTRIRAALVSGYFDSRQRLWEEPIYRNVFGLLREFGDAEIASLIAPRRLIVEYSDPIKVSGPPTTRDGRRGAAPGRIDTPDFLSVESEVRRANDLTGRLQGRAAIELVSGAEGMLVKPGSTRALELLLESAGIHQRLKAPTPLSSGSEGGTNQSGLSAKREVQESREFWQKERQRPLVGELVQHVQQLFRDSERTRDAMVWNHLKSKPDVAWESLCHTNRARLWEEVIGKFPRDNTPLNPRSRSLPGSGKWHRYEVVLDVFPEVFAWGQLLIPGDIKPGERRPVVVCQHGLEGVPEDAVTEDAKTSAFQAYQAFAARLADRGFVVYVPHNPYRGGDRFRVLQRKANPLGKSLFSIIIAQHDAALDWLSGLPFVDPQRIGFYGLSYGGKTAMRVPALLDRYCLAICSGDFNEWVQKNVTVDSPYSYMFTGEYEMPEWNLGHTFNYAEMASLIAPRPFMVERGHFDGVAPDHWVAYEYAKVRRMYDLIGLPERTEIEFFNGPHRINGVGTYRFLHHHLQWPGPK